MHETSRRAMSILLPRHPVLRESSATTKIRIAFDTSCQSNSGVSLNVVLIKGQDEHACIIARFGSYKFVVSADIKK